MPVRKTESHLPADCDPSELGETVVSRDGGGVLVSFITSPLVVGRGNTYVVFVTDGGLATSVQSFQWSFSENGGTPHLETTNAGEITYLPQATGTLAVAVRCLDTGGIERAKLELDQAVVDPHAGLEALIAAAADEPGPTAAHPDVSRELVNDYNAYYQGIRPKTAEPGDGFQRLVFSFIMESALQVDAVRRKADLDAMAAVLNSGSAGFAALAAKGLGLCRLRPALLAMIVGPHLPWTEIPEDYPAHAVAAKKLHRQAAQLPEQTRVDLFNLIRFPKSSITQCGRVIEALRDRYFRASDFNAVISGLSGTRAHWIDRHYREGPLSRA